MNFDDIPGLNLKKDFINEEDELLIMKEIDSKEWYSNFSQRMMQLGYYEDSQGVNHHDQNRPITDILISLLNKTERVYNLSFDQIIVREYKRGQGLVNYRNKVVITSKVLILSLGEGCNIIFISPDGEQFREKWLPRRSILSLEGDVLNNWRYTIERNMLMYNAEGYEIEKGVNYRRIELTIRDV